MSVVILFHNAQNGQVQLITEGCDQQQACELMQQMLNHVNGQVGVITPSGPPQPPPAPRPRNIREIITPK